MIHEILPVGPLQCNCSIIGDENTREAMVIDPGDEIEDVVALLQKHGLTVKQIVITHAHIDHIDYALLKMLDVQAAWVGMAVPEQVQIDQPLANGDKLQTGNLEATVMHTPGHTEGSVCLYFAAEHKLIAGDTLFAGSIGRTDLPGGNSRQIIDSIHSRLLVLPEETRVLPGHGPATTIGEEKQRNPFLT